MRTVILAAMVLIVTAPGFAEDEGPWFACTTPIAAPTSAASVLSHWPAKARRDVVETEEGRVLPAITLFGKSAADGLSIIWWDQKQTAPKRLWTLSPRWQAVGLHTGASLAEVEAANGGPFLLSGFGGASGGFVTDMKGGKLERAAGNACRLQLRFGAPETTPETMSGPVPDGLAGEGRILSSADPALRAFRPVLREIGVVWALPKGVAAAAEGAKEAHPVKDLP